MPFSYSCFFSYRHSPYEQWRQRARTVIDSLKEHLDISASLPVFLDEERLKGGEFYQESLARQLCESVCMIMLYWPTYFSENHTFCSREFKLMEKLEAERLEYLPESEKDKGLIIVAALADFDQLPAEILKKRKCFNFEPCMLVKNPRNHPQFGEYMREIRRYVAERARVLGAMPPPDPCLDCGKCRLPDDQYVLPWLKMVLNPNLSFPTRAPGR